MGTNQILKTSNVLGQEVEVYIGLTKKESHAWEGKKITKDCQDCQKCIDRQEAIDIIEIVKKKRRGNERMLSSANLILGLCIWGAGVKILTPTRTLSIEELKRCRYFRR